MNARTEHLCVTVFAIGWYTEKDRKALAMNTMTRILLISLLTAGVSTNAYSSEGALKGLNRLNIDTTMAKESPCGLNKVNIEQIAKAQISKTSIEISDIIYPGLWINVEELPLEFAVPIETAGKISNVKTEICAIQLYFGVFVRADVTLSYASRPLKTKITLYENSQLVVCHKNRCDSDLQHRFGLAMEGFIHTWQFHQTCGTTCD